MATYYWVGGTGTWDNVNTANWSTTSGGAGGAGPPTNAGADAAVFDANSGTGVCTTASTAEVRTLTLSSANMTLSLGANFTFATGGSAVFTAGALQLNSYTLTTTVFNIDGSTARTMSFGTGKLVLTGNAGTIWNCITATNLTVTGTPRVEFTYTGSTGTREIYGASSAGGTEANAISFYILGGSDTIAFRGRALDLSFTSFTGTFNATVQGTLIYGDLVLSAGMAFNGTTVSFLSSIAGRNITFGGVTMNANVAFNNATGSWTLQDNLAISSTLTLTLTAGTLNANNNNVSIGNFALGVGTKTLTLGSGTWTVAGANWNANTNVTGLTVSASTGTISMTSGSAKTFAGGGRTWPTLNQGGSGALTIQQSNTFANITNTVQPATISLTAGTTTTVTDFDVSGTSGNLITLNSTSAGSRATLTDSGGVNSVSYVDIKDIAATGYGEWQAYTSNGNVDSGNNVGWVFAAPPPLTASEYQISFKSFTERRSF